jgi:magnesium-transporting ATPase (P-type)
MVRIGSPPVLAFTVVFHLTLACIGYTSDDVFLTAFFCFFIFITNVNAFNNRTTKPDLFDGLWENRNFVAVSALIFTMQITFTYIGGSWLRTVGLTIGEWFIILLLSSTIIPFDLARKIFIVPRLERRWQQIFGTQSDARRYMEFV